VHDTKALGSDVPDAWLGQPVTVGIRPEGIRAAGPGEAGFDADVEVVEPVGSDVFANLRLVVQPQALHVFDRESGLRRALPA
jgi:multiple sugar transport system ATP-binding protein